MEVQKTTVGYHLLKLFTENVAFTIAEFLVESEEVKKAKAACKQYCESLKFALRNGGRLRFTKYHKNFNAI